MEQRLDGGRLEAALAVIFIEHIGLDGVAAGEQLLLSVVGAGEPRVGGHMQIQSAVIARVGKDTAHRCRLAAKAGSSSDVTEFSATEIL